MKYVFGPGVIPLSTIRRRRNESQNFFPFSFPMPGGENQHLQSIFADMERFRAWLSSVPSAVDASLSLSVPSELSTASRRTQGTGMCSKCPGFVYILPEEFREHSKSEWHLFNLRQSPGDALSFEDWCELDSNSECSSASSDTSSTFPTDGASRGKLIIDGIPFTEVVGSSIAVASVISDPRVFLTASYVSVLLLRAGRFAGAVWDASGSVVAHTSFKRYTVRRKNGGSQSKNDRARNSPAQSVGAQIRRAQEKKLSEEVVELIQSTWVRYFSDQDSIVFAYASKSLVADMFVGPLNKQNPTCHVFPIPMSLRDPTFAEVNRVYRSLTRYAILNS